MTNLPSGVTTSVELSPLLPPLFSLFTTSSSDEQAGAHITAASNPKEKIFFIAIYIFCYIIL
jgi:hypothetical protein